MIHSAHAGLRIVHTRCNTGAQNRNNQFIFTRDKVLTRQNFNSLTRKASIKVGIERESSCIMHNQPLLSGYCRNSSGYR